MGEWRFCYFLYPATQKVAGYYVIPAKLLSVRLPSVRANIRGLGASLSMFMRFIPLRIHWVALKPIFFFYVLGATSLWEFNMEVAHKPKMLERLSVRPSVCPSALCFRALNFSTFWPIFFKLCIDIGTGEEWYGIASGLISFWNNRVMALDLWPKCFALRFRALTLVPFYRFSSNFA